MADIVVDLGTVNTLIQTRDGGLVVDEPSVMAVRAGTGRVVGGGADANRMLGRAPEGVVVVQPMRDGVIADVDPAELMLRHFLKRVFPRGILRAKRRVVIGVPSGITDLERRAVRSVVLPAGAKSVFMISEPVAAAIGVGLPATAPRASMVVNVGGGTTEIGVIALSGVVAGASLGVAGNEFDAAISAFVRKRHSLRIGETSAEAVKTRIGSAYAWRSVRWRSAGGTSSTATGRAGHGVALRSPPAPPRGRDSSSSRPRLCSPWHGGWNADC